MAAKRKILYVCQQVSPYVGDNPRSLATRELLQAMHERNNEIRTFMPRYGTINERRNQLHEVIRLSGMNLIIDDTDHQLIIKVASIPSARIQIYFIDNDDYFARKAILTDEAGAEFEDNDERAIFFARGVLETVKKLRWEPSIVEVHGWFAGFIAAYLRHTFADDPIFANVKVVVSLDDDTFDGVLDPATRSKLEGEGILGKSLELLDEPTYENFCRFVISYADGVVISSDKVDDSIVEIARNSGKPLLEYAGYDPENAAEVAEYYDNYDKFYERI
ncbi:MAG: glycogen/starch synthase [Rikenellaceae bacterium]